MNAPSEERQRTEVIARRQKESLFWQVVHGLGSLRLAVFLLITIALAVAVATLCESSFNSKVAHAYIYAAPWFMAWLVMLCVNLLCAALTRWPWQKKHTGFVITHAGIIILLIGAMIGRLTGFEANITLRKGEPSGRLILNETILQMDSPADGDTYMTPFDVSVRVPSEARPRQLTLPGSPIRLVVTQYTENLRLVPAIQPAPEGFAGVPGVELKFSSGMMRQEIDVSLIREPAAGRSFNFFGMAKIEMVEKFTPEQKKITDLSKGLPYREVQMLFARNPTEPVVSNTLDVPSGHRLELLENPGQRGRFFIRSVTSGGIEKIFPVDAKGSVDIGAGPGVKVFVDGYWPDFRMVNGKPATVSREPHNPVAIVRLEGTLVPTGRLSESMPRPVMKIAPLPGGRIEYLITRAGYTTSAGTVKEGDSFAVGWADWQARVVRVLPEAIMATVVREIDESSARMMDPKEMISGLRAHLRDPDGTVGEARWIASGSVEPLPLKGQSHRVGFGLKTLPLPFLMTLEEFEVPRFEGTTDPSDFISRVRFEEMKTGETKTSVIRMNQPASFPADWWRPWTGINYKFSQAQWNPSDVDRTTYQVLYDPGWLCKWIGSLLISVGIFTMFYLKPRLRGRTQTPQDLSQ
ncbi:MAG: hypothetical protein SFY92_06865 [Verrucomicrobiae bacterium]|nr:hypothetical protein [Verrucomicrobiae bacterium]